MLRSLLRSKKIHTATVSQADLHYNATITVDPVSLDAAGQANSHAT